MERNPEYVIRPGIRADCQAIADIYNQGIADRNATFDEFDVLAERYSGYFENDGRRALVCAASGDEVIGWAAADPVSDRHAYRFTAQGAIYVKRGHRKGGLGHRLSQELGRLASDLGYHSIIGEILSTNAPGIAMNLRDGYHVIGEIREAGFRDGQWVGLVVVQKMLVG
jgi:L-amino acid N-acyltransferase YncA